MIVWDQPTCYDRTADIFLETDRLILHPFRDEDFADFCIFAMDEERNHVMGNPPVPEETEVRAFFHWLKDEERRAYAIVLKATDRVVGNLTVYDSSSVSDLPELEGRQSREMSFSIAPPYRRQGLMEEALRAVISHLFWVENVDYITSGYFTFNEPSRALHEKLGFTFLDTERLRLPDTGEEAPLTKETLESEFFQNYAHTMIPMARYGKEGELDSAATFLSAPTSTYVNGVILPVDGGYTAM